MRLILPMMAMLLGAAPVTAQTEPEIGTFDFPVIGTVPQLCILGAPVLSLTGQPVNVLTLSGNVLEIESLTTPDTLTPQATSAEIALEAVCNSSHRLVLTSENNGLWRGTASEDAPAGFASAVPYSAELVWGEESLLLQADAELRAEARASMASAAEVGPLLLTVRILPGETNTLQQAPLVAGVYTDTLRVTVEPE